MGAVYVSVTADAANNGIMTMDASGGATGGSYWISWTPEGGFSGTGWDVAWNSPNVPLKSAWESGAAADYPNTYDGFLSYVQTGVSDLTPWLDGAGWTSEQKYAFAHDEVSSVWMNCTSPA